MVEVGPAGLCEGERPGYPRRLSQKQLRDVNGVLRRTPRNVALWGTLIHRQNDGSLNRAMLAPGAFSSF